MTDDKLKSKELPKTRAQVLLTLINKMQYNNTPLGNMVLLGTILTNYWLLTLTGMIQNDFLEVLVSANLAFIMMDLLKLYAKYKTNKLIYSMFNVKDEKELQERVKAQQDYVKKLSQLPPDALNEVTQKAMSLNEQVEQYKKQPDWYFKNQGYSSKEEAIKKVDKDFKTWLKSKGYPVLSM